VDRGVTAAGRCPARSAGTTTSSCAGSGGTRGSQCSGPIRHAWRVEVAHGRLDAPHRLAKSFENPTTSATGWLKVACITTTCATCHRYMPRDTPARSVTRGVGGRAECGLGGHVQYLTSQIAHCMLMRPTPRPVLRHSRRSARSRATSGPSPYVCVWRPTTRSVRVSSRCQRRTGQKAFTVRDLPRPQHRRDATRARTADR
jgi:hypothetical protein